MLGAGVIEGFFGPEWSWENRRLFCRSIREQGGDFYIYAPKRDPYLRKNWMTPHPTERWEHLKNLREECRRQKIRFGIGLSPFEIHEHWNADTRSRLKEKVRCLEELDFDHLGLFFDDMKGAADLADKQAEILSFIQSLTSKNLLFCPTYYSDDPILDKVFGARAPDYLEKIGKNISQDVGFFWTGSKVISKVITAEELKVVEKILRRKPLLWDNFFANDGPRQCQFLRMKPFDGRDEKAFQAADGWALNLMNQASLSRILFASSLRVLKRHEEPRDSFLKSLQEMAGSEFADFILRNEQALNTLGLNKMEESLKTEWTRRLEPENIYARDVLDWLKGQYIVGAECLTD
jgi:hypothetical protein